MKHLPLVIALALGLSGCDLVKELGAKVAKAYPEETQMNLVIHSGYKMLVGGQAVSVFGMNDCPPADKNMKAIFGASPDEGSRSCIVIAPKTKTVSVIVSFPEGPSAETWTVEWSGNRSTLRRADGTFIAAAK
ncbi:MULTISPECIES: hypothetical protein [Pseudomonas]|uniref:Lipoprotein n=1 Tax=Pseudomonas fluorescens TaxID=294 RepID=A0A162B2E1_PSEFL|nr:MULTISPECIES: hypothetical protein [Pseudomonas]KZN20646.1 hypothetical protein A1D17_03650 [Pseudomonas fluorescens]